MFFLDLASKFNKTGLEHTIISNINGTIDNVGLPKSLRASSDRVPTEVFRKPQCNIPTRFGACGKTLALVQDNEYADLDVRF